MKAYVNTAEYVNLVDDFTRSRVWQEAKDVILDRILPEDRVLDFNSGTGRLLQSIAQHEGSTRLYGVEENWLLRDIARSRVPQASFLPLEKMQAVGKVDVLTCTFALGRMADPWSGLWRLRIQLKPNGLLVLALSDPTYQKLKHAAAVFTRKKYDPTVRWMWGVRRMRYILHSRGFKLRKVYPVGGSILGLREGHVFVAEVE